MGSRRPWERLLQTASGPARWVGHVRRVGLAAGGCYVYRACHHSKVWQGWPEQLLRPPVASIPEAPQTTLPLAISLQSYSLHRELLPACHALRLESLTNRSGTVDAARMTLLSFQDGSLLMARLRFRRLRGVTDVSFCVW